MGMKTLFLSVLSFFASVGESVGEYGTVVAKRSGDEVVVTVSGAKGWTLNTEYPGKLTMGVQSWSTYHIVWKDCTGPKAGSGVWKVKTNGTSGSVKMVFCNSSQCSAPIKSNFEVR